MYGALYGLIWHDESHLANDILEINNGKTMRVKTQIVTCCCFGGIN